MMHRKNVSVNEPSPTSAGKTTEFTGYPRKLCWLLSRRQTSSKNKQQLTGVVGAVAELIEVPEEYTVAIETALGASAQHVVVETERDARAAITYLKQNRGGRATFLPLTTIKSRQLPSYAVSQAQQVPGFIGVASELVRFNEDVKTLPKIYWEVSSSQKI